MKRTGRSGCVALVGRRLEHNDHLGIGYLEAALAASAVQCRTHVLNHIENVMPIARAICAQQPDVVGISLQDGGSAVLPLALGELLRRKGYRGHITAGGPFATLARAWLLDRYAWLDSVVRFAGEAPLLALVRASIEGDPITSVAGVSTRAGDGPPADVLNPLPMQLAPVRHDGMRILGRKAAHLSATRGCAGRCSYCGPAALQEAEVEEGLRGGHSKQQLAAAGVGGIRRRSVADVAVEMDELARAGHGYLYFVDEHPLPSREPDAVAWLSELQLRLAAARTPAFATGCMLRAERMTRDIVHKFAQVGLARCYVGVEFPSAEQGKLFKRSCRPAHALSMLRELDACGVATMSNLMLVHPYSTASSIEEGLRFLDGIEHGLFEATHMKAYHGTALHRRLLEERRLYGNPLRWDYFLADPVAQRFAELSVRIRMEVFGNHSLVQRLHELHTELAVARRLGLKVEAGDTARTLEDLGSRLSRLAAMALHKALEVARSSLDRQQVGDLIGELAELAALFDTEIEQFEVDFHRALGVTQRRFSPVVAVAASSLFFLFASASPGCASPRASRQDAAVMQDTLTLADAEIAIPSCGTAIAQSAVDRVVAAVPCFSGYISGYIGQNAATFGLSTNITVRPCDGNTTARFSELADAASAALQGLDTSGCSLYTTVENQDDAKLVRAISSCSPAGYGAGYAVVLDGNGTVVDVRATADGGTDSEVLNCILAAVGGLTFPCLSNNQICPEQIVTDY